MYAKSILSFAAIAALSACGGSSTGPASFTTVGSPPPATSNQVAFDERVSRGIALGDKYDDVVPTSNMPTSGTASYAGLAGFADVPDPDEADLIGSADVSMTATFTPSGGSVSGSMTNFLGLNDDTNQVEALQGTLTIADQTIIGNGFVTTVSGTLTDPGGTLNVTGSMNGQFLGDEAAAIGATMILSDGEDDAPIYGRLIAEKQ